MLNRKLLEVASRLSDSDHKRLRLYLQSPYFNSTYNAGKIVQLYDHILKYGADEKHPELDKARVAEIFFPDKPFSEKGKGPIDSLASDLFRLVRGFIHQAEWEEGDTPAKDLLSLARFYRKHGLEDRFRPLVESIRKAQQEQAARDADYYLTQFQIEEEIANFKSIYNSNEDDLNLLAVHHNLDTFYLISKAEALSSSAFHHKISAAKSLPDSSITDMMLHIISSQSFSDIPIARAYQLVYLLIRDPAQETLFAELEEILERGKAALPAHKYSNLQALYRALWGFRYRQEKGAKFIVQLFELFARHLEKGYFYIDGKILTTSLRAITLLGLRAAKFDWVHEFLENHPPDRITGTRFPMEFYNLNYAEYHLALRQYDKAEACLSYQLFENATFSIWADLVLIKIYYETKDELLEPRIKALDQKVRRSGISQENKVFYLNFLQKLAKILKYGWEKESPRLAKLREEIQTTPNIASREWLLEKLDQN